MNPLRQTVPAVPTLPWLRGVGLTLFGIVVGALARDLRWGWGGLEGPLAGGPRALAQVLILETVIGAVWALGVGLDKPLGGRVGSRRAGFGSEFWVDALVGPACLALLSCAVVAWPCRTIGLWIDFILAQVAVLATASCAAALGRLLRLRVRRAGDATALGVALLTSWLCTIFLAGPFAPLLSERPRALSAVLAFDPLITVTRLVGVDHLRGERIYRLTDLGTYRFTYPPRVAGVAFQLLLAAALLACGRRATIRQGENV